MSEYNITYIWGAKGRKLNRLTGQLEHNGDRSGLISMPRTVSATCVMQKNSLMSSSNLLSVLHITSYLFILYWGTKSDVPSQAL
jgi:hypothetical protein